jgi:Uma2 family endonuclease
MGFGRGCLAADIAHLLGQFLDEHDLGDIAGTSATMRLTEGLVRSPSVSFIRWEKLPGRQRPTKPIPDLVPDLAVEVVSEGNTPGEMSRKRNEYFLAGVQLVWQVDMEKRTVEVFKAPDQSLVLTENDTLDGGDVLPGLQLPVKRVFARVPLSHSSAPTTPSTAASKLPE